MKPFKSFGEIDYNEILELDGAFSISHINYGEAPLFNGIDARDIAVESRMDSFSVRENIEDILGQLRLFDGTEKNYNQEDSLQLWELYWKEYIYAFDKLIQVLPKSVVTLYVGRHAVELGMKYILLKTNNSIPMHHNLGNLANQVFAVNEIEEEYMNDIVFFCESYTKYIEGGNAEYFRFPQYKDGYFAGNRLDIKWLSYNFALIILKLMHFAGMDEE